MKAILVLAMLLLICGPALAEPQNVESLLSQGRSYYANGFLQNALEAFENATLLDPTNAPAWHDKGMVLQRLGRTEEAVEALKKAEGLTSKSETEQTKASGAQLKVPNESQKTTMSCGITKEQVIPLMYPFLWSVANPNSTLPSYKLTDGEKELAYMCFLAGKDAGEANIKGAWVKSMRISKILSQEEYEKEMYNVNLRIRGYNSAIKELFGDDSRINDILIDEHAV